MNITIEDRMESIEQQLKELRKEMEESIARYNAYGKSYPFTHGDISKFRSGQIGDIEEPVGFIPMTAQEWKNYINESYKGANISTKCLWDIIPLEDRMKPMGLSCSCRKCSAYC